MSAQDHEVADLLGAYALDAVEPDEARRVDAHLATCPRCRAEVEMYRETAAFLAYAGTDAPEGIWARIGQQIASEEVHGPVGAPDLRAARAHRSSGWARAAFVGLAAVAAAAVAVLAIEIGSLNGQVGRLQAAERANGLATVVLSALVSPHREVVLTSADQRTSASVAIAPDGSAYWLGSSLESLPTSRTYEVWGAKNGSLIDLGLIGNRPGRLGTFHVQDGVTELLITNEPKGGTKTPTTPVLISGQVPALT